jgi:hypothetical protein
MFAYAQQDRLQAFDDADGGAGIGHAAGTSPDIGGTPPRAQGRRMRSFFDKSAHGFFAALVTCRQSRIMVTTRLYPAQLENFDGQRLRGVRHLQLTGLDQDDAVSLARGFAL